MRRYKKEKRLRRQIQDQLDEESIKKAKLEEALSAVSYQTYVQLKDESWFNQLRVEEVFISSSFFYYIDWTRKFSHN